MACGCVDHTLIDLSCPSATKLVVSAGSGSQFHCLYLTLFALLSSNSKHEST